MYLTLCTERKFTVEPLRILYSSAMIVSENYPRRSRFNTVASLSAVAIMCAAAFKGVGGTAPLQAAWEDVVGKAWQTALQNASPRHGQEGQESYLASPSIDCLASQQYGLVRIETRTDNLKSYTIIARSVGKTALDIPKAQQCIQNATQIPVRIQDTGSK